MRIYEQFSEKELEILEARARQLASTSQDDQGGEITTALTVGIGKEKYALPVEALTVVQDDIPIIPVPCVPSYVAGIANIRGHIIPVIDLAVLLNVPDDSAVDTGSLIVATNDQFNVALRVDTVGEVVSLWGGDLFPVFQTVDTHQNLYLKSMTADGVGVLDVEAILNDPALVIAEAIS
jgi:purine-binding chemotaxis protein CheW